jgi:uncharacterized damage-inducible protein DinB
MAEAQLQQSPKQSFLENLEREHEVTRKVIAAFPESAADVRPHPTKSKTAKELCYVFVAERAFGAFILSDGLAKGPPPFGEMPPAPATFAEVLQADAKAHADYVALVNSYTDEQLNELITFFAGPGQTVKMPRIQLLWIFLCDEIHHRGQLTTYLRLADAKVPSVYGPTHDEPWM